MSSRRQPLERYSEPLSTTNAGLWLDKYLCSYGAEDKNAKQKLVEQVASCAVPGAYESYFARWHHALESIQAQTREATVSGRLAVGLGDESVLETSVTLHHTYGVPYIPGSALKGVAASYARKRLADPAWNKDTGYAYKTVFGDTKCAGYITFFDALYVPKSSRQPLYADVLTVHHRDYYQGLNKPPADWDDPNPVPFLSATGTYLLALSGLDDWVDTAFLILQLALSEFGVGAKTSSGYGRMTVVPPPLDLDKARVDNFLERLDRLPSHRVASEIQRFVDEQRRMDVSEKYKRILAQAIIAKVQAARREKVSREKAWYQELLAVVNS